MEHSEPLVVPGCTIRWLMGLWQPQGRGSSFLSRLRSAMTLICIAFLVLCVTLKLSADPPQELEQLTLCCLVVSICVGFLCKVALFVAQGSTMRESVRLLEDARTQFCNGDNNQLTRHRYQKLSDNIYYYYQVVAVPAVIGWVLCPLLSSSVTMTDQDQQEARRQLPMPVWLPFDINKSPTYEFLYVAQSICSLVTSQSCLSVDIFFVYMMLMAAAEFEVLNDNVSAMEYTNMKKARTEPEEFISKYKRSGGNLALPQNGQDLGEETYIENAKHTWLHQQLLKNVLHHQKILRSVSLLQSGMNVSIFCLLFINMANLCSSLFVAAVLLQRDGSVGKALNALSTIPVQLYETTIYCIYAHILTDQSDRLMYSAFSCSWIDSDVRFKRSLSIFMMVTVQPIRITVGKMCTLSKQMLLQVLNGTYGLLNMLYYLHRSK
ncbi:odorant receptor 43a-like [Schistocerca gregaria]|uniref:odorant receptor 43a-like n=1 Tax=Schistocerca gregaria TaxID=7010 RepID=UPI00211E74BB|nr:odorant receptor 43a-like [Schistocerca gregaria]